MSDTPINPDQLSDEDLPVDFGRYTLTKVLGEGGMARVFLGNLAGPQGFRKPCAIKVLHSSVARRGEKFLLTLSNEARLGGLLNHPNVVNTYDFGNVGGQPFIAMEFIDGLGIDRLLEEVRRPPIEVTLELAIQMCAGLEYAHNIQVDGEAGNLVHRDLKPSNVILSRNGVVKVMDFGIAKASNLTGNLTGVGMTKGTPPFMSPEQMAAEDLDRRSDIFAMGSLLYEIATGKRLFNEASVSAVISSVMNVGRVLHEERRLDPLDNVFPDLKPILQRCLAPAPEERYSSARALAADLKRLQRRLPLGDSLEEYVQAVLRGEVSPTPIEEDEASNATNVTADHATPVVPVGTESMAIHFEESNETDTIEATTQGDHLRPSGDSADRLEPIPEFVMDSGSSTEKQSEAHETQLNAPAVGSGTVVVARTDSRIQSQNKPNSSDNSGRPQRRPGGRNNRNRGGAKRGAPLIRIFLLIGLCIALGAAVVFMLDKISGSEPQKGPDDIKSEELHGEDAEGETAEVETEKPQEGTSSDRDRRRKNGTKKAKKKGRSQDERESPKRDEKEAEAEAKKDRESKEKPKSPRSSETSTRTESSSSRRGTERRTSGGRTSPPDDGAQDTSSEPAVSNRLLKLESAPKEVFAGRRTKFRVSIPNLRSGDSFSVKLAMQCAPERSENRWRSYSLKRQGRTQWEVLVQLNDRDQGLCKYYFYADPKNETRKISGKVYLGNKSNPYTMIVR